MSFDSIKTGSRAEISVKNSSVKYTSLVEKLWSGKASPLYPYDVWKNY